MDPTSRQAFQVHVIIFSPWCHHTSLFLFLFQSLCKRKKNKNQPSLLMLCACCFSLSPLLGRRKRKKRSRSPSRHRREFGNETVPLGIVVLLLSHTPNLQVRRVLGRFPGSPDQPAASFDQDRLLLNRLARTLFFF